MKSAVTKVANSGIQTTSFAKVAEAMARFPVRPKRAVSKAVKLTLRPRLHTAHLVAGKIKQDARIRVTHVQLAVLWKTSVTASIVESQARAKNKATVTAVI